MAKAPKDKTAIVAAAPAPVAPTFKSDATLICGEAANFARVVIKSDVAAALTRRVADAAEFLSIKNEWRIQRYSAEVKELGGETTLARAKAAMAQLKDGNLLFHGAKGDAALQRTALEQSAYKATCNAWDYFRRAYNFDDPTSQKRAPSGNTNQNAPKSDNAPKTDQNAPAPAPKATDVINPDAIQVVTCTELNAAMAQLKVWDNFGQRVGNASAKALMGDKGERVRRLLAYVHAEVAALELMN